MGKFVFKYILDDGSKVIHVKKDAPLYELLEEFELFLISCGFSFEGHIDLVTAINSPARKEFENEEKEFDKEAEKD